MATRVTNTTPPVGRAGPRQPPAAETVRLYARDWAEFCGWCHATGRRSLPADPPTLAAYVANLARLSRGALDRRIAAIADAHRTHGLPPPSRNLDLRRALRAAPHPHRGLRKNQTPAQRTSHARLVAMAATCPGDLAGTRDRALLLLMAATRSGGEAISRTHLVGLDVEHLRFAREGLAIVIPDDGDARHVTILRGVVSSGASAATARPSRHSRFGLCPVAALEMWLRVSDTRFGPVFRKIDRWSNIEHHRLGNDAIRRILSRRRPRRAPATRERKEKAISDLQEGSAPVWGAPRGERAP